MHECNERLLAPMSCCQFAITSWPFHVIGPLSQQVGPIIFREFQGNQINQPTRYPNNPQPPHFGEEIPLGQTPPLFTRQRPRQRLRLRRRGEDWKLRVLRRGEAVFRRLAERVAAP